jgi:hypothetical protein
MAALKVGDMETAKKSLAAATAATKDFVGKEDPSHQPGRVRGAGQKLFTSVTF